MQVIMAAALILLEREERRALQRQRVFRDRLHPLDTYDDTELMQRYRVTRPVLLEVIDLVDDDVAHTPDAHVLFQHPSKYV